MRFNGIDNPFINKGHESWVKCYSYLSEFLMFPGAPVVAGISPNISRMDHLDRNSPAMPSPILVR